jgi:transcriptional regulator with XRE-family HTH domain
MRMAEHDDNRGADPSGTIAIYSTGHSKQLRERLRDRREKLGLTLEQVAEQTGSILSALNPDEKETTLTAGSISHYELFRRHPRVDTMAAWARAVGMRLVVDLEHADSDRVNVPLSPRAARIARMLEGLKPRDLDRVEDTVRRYLGLEEDD